MSSQDWSSQAWSSYDSASATYDRLSAPRTFAPVAQDLIHQLDLQLGARVLDVGCGTGVAALFALKMVGTEGLVAGLDLSPAMLGLARSNGLRRVVCGRVPNLPFPEASFDAVLANFVVNHCEQYPAALAEMARVLRAGGRLGVTAWGVVDCEPRSLWRSLAESAVDTEVLSRQLREAIPWEEWFSDPDRLRRAVEDAGLEKIALEERTYRCNWSVSDYLDARESSMTARIVRYAGGEERWQQFREKCASTFSARFSDPIVDVTRAFLCTGTKV
jgi:ubiquinone/menaquinone biosynthesis C-methylase UbiE